VIVDKVERWGQYHLGEAWECAFGFLASLSPDTEEKKYILQGDDIYAQVMSYETKATEAALLETHRKYVDIQAVLVGGEDMEWFPREGLAVDVPYDESKDAEFYKRTSSGLARVSVNPGTFVVFYPQDAHMPSLMVNGVSQLVKKVVIKIRAELLLGSAG
jgi:biofilm protein TabA